MRNPSDVRPGIQILDIKIRDIQQHDPDEDTLLGICEILGVDHHAQFIRVENVWDAVDKYDVQQGTNDPYHRYDDIQKVYECSAFATVRVPGFDGEWVVLIHPFDG